jgi:hypothetical protein
MWLGGEAVDLRGTRAHACARACVCVLCALFVYGHTSMCGCSEHVSIGVCAASNTARTPTTRGLSLSALVSFHCVKTINRRDNYSFT